MAFSFPGVPSNGMPRSRARTIFSWVGGGDLIGSRAEESTASMNMSRNTEIKLGVHLLNIEKTFNAQRPTLNQNHRNSVSVAIRVSSWSEFYFLFHGGAGAVRLSMRVTRFSQGNIGRRLLMISWDKRMSRAL